MIAPLNVAKFTWAMEAEKWDHTRGLRVEKLLGSARDRLAALEMDAELYVINRENVQWLVEECLKRKRWPFDMVVIDELSSFKSSRSKRWRMLRKVIGASRYVIGLTGTPAPNGYLDLWPEMALIDGGERLGKTLTAYRDAYFNPGARRGHVVFDYKLKRGAKQEIDGKLSDICLSMSKEDWLDMPELSVIDVWVGMDTKSRATYEQLKRDRILPLLGGELTGDIDSADSAIVGGMAATLSGKLLQMANGFAYDDAGEVIRFHDAKLDALRELREAANYQPMLVFYQFRADRDRILSAMPDAVELNDTTISAWNEGKVPVLLCHPASAGHGLNLQKGGNIMVWFGLPWSLELYQQAIARLFRLGQEKRVLVYRILCEDTLDGRTAAALDGKDRTQRGLLDALRGYLKEAVEDKELRPE